jgi:hypothetical protein
LSLRWPCTSDGNGVGSRFRATMNHKESGLPENDSRPLAPVPLRNTWPGAYRKFTGKRIDDNHYEWHFKGKVGDEENVEITGKYVRKSQ